MMTTTTNSMLQKIKGLPLVVKFAIPTGVLLILLLLYCVLPGSNTLVRKLPIGYTETSIGTFAPYNNLTMTMGQVLQLCSEHPDSEFIIGIEGDFCDLSKAIRQKKVKGSSTFKCTAIAKNGKACGVVLNERR